MRHPQWTSEHRDALLTRVTVITAGVAAVSAVGAVALAAGLQATTTYAASPKAGTATPPAPEAAQALPSDPSPATPEDSPSQDDGTATPAPATALVPDQIHLVIYNATSTKGVAAAAAKILRNEGFHVDTTAANPGGALRSSSILYSSSSSAGVRAVAKATGIQHTAAGDTGDVVVLVLGRDWVSATAGTAWAPPQAAPQSSGGGGGGGPVTSSGGS